MEGFRRLWTGNVLIPSGHPAKTISSTEGGK